MVATERDAIVAELATVETLLAAAPDDDVLGRRSLKARRDILAQELVTLTAQVLSIDTHGTATLIANMAID
jgi:hypothetical protein